MYVYMADICMFVHPWPRMRVRPAAATVATAPKLWSLKSFQLVDISNDIKTWTQVHDSKWVWPLAFGVCWDLLKFESQMGELKV